MLVELGLVEQRDQAVLEVLGDGATVTDVARRHGVARQTVHGWLGKCAIEGLRGLADRSSRAGATVVIDPSVPARNVDQTTGEQFAPGQRVWSLVLDDGNVVVADGVTQDVTVDIAG